MSPPGRPPSRRDAAAVDPAAEGSNPPLVPANGYFEGQVAVVGDTRISGSVQGSLRGPGHLTIDSGGHVDGVIDCDSLAASGRISGSVQARRHVQLSTGAHLEGDIDAPSINMTDDAIWNGKARIGQ
jgi:cytoskeletal protein CcmA (bactofilin family)